MTTVKLYNVRNVNTLGGRGRERQGEEVGGEEGEEKTEDILDSILSRFH